MKIRIEKITDRKFKVIGKDGEGIVQQGIVDKQWRIKYGACVDIVSSKESGIEELKRFVDSSYNEKVFKEQCKVLEETE